MLFNTLEYARFFACVFFVSWVLSRRANAALLPWLGLAGFALWHANLQSAVVTAVAGGLSIACLRWCKQARLRAPLLVGISLVGVSWLSYDQTGSDPLGLALQNFDVVAQTPGWLMAPQIVALGVAGTFFVRAKKVRLLFLLFSSYVFYAHWDWRFLPLIWGSSTADWLLGNQIAKTEDPRRRKQWLLGTVVLNLGVLGTFKYLNFGIDSLRASLLALGVDAPEFAVSVALPVGISFFTFESMSYVIDIYRRDIEPQKSYAEYLSFVAFFPHLVAGPIVRPRDLLPQLAGPPRFNPKEASEGLFWIGVGLFKKIAIGDYLALNLIDRVFDAPLQYSALECYTAIVAYAVQIYCDFSGYTDIAIGCALLLGVRFPLNFNAPYKATNIMDFWRRWHISLSTWLRDYLYIPLGGNRKGPGRTTVNLITTMLLGGLWHGAAWTFVVWGGLHGVALAITRWWTRRRSTAPSKSWAARAFAVVLTFHLVCIGWVFFRAESFDKARLIFFQLSSLSTYHPNLPLGVLGVLALGLVSHFIPEKWYEAGRDRLIELPAPVQGLLLFALALALRKMASAEAVPFVYFQF